MQNSVEYHVKSIRCALLREELGGVAALDSSLFRRAVSALIEEHGMTEADIVKAWEGMK